MIELDQERPDFRRGLTENQKRLPGDPPVPDECHDIMMELDKARRVYRI